MTDTYQVDQLRRDIINNDVAIKSLIQDIHVCEALDLLNELNADGRAKLSQLRTGIERLETYGKETFDDTITKEAQNFREQYFSTCKLFRKANVSSILAIEKAQKEELFHETEESAVIRRRNKKDKANLVKMSSGITDQLLSISRRLAETTQKSAETLGSLANSSTTVVGSHDELQSTKDVISQSGKLLAKYSRRQFTDKLIILLGFVFFLACCLYIIRKRLF